jgi:AraC-like DNA-binding protein
MTSVTVSCESRSFSTAGLTPAQQMEMWQAHHSNVLMALDCRAFSGEEFSGSSVNVETPRAVIARVRADTAHVIERRLELIRRHPGESVVLFLAVSGEAFFYNNDVSRTLRPGHMLVCDSDTPFIRGFGQRYEEVFIKVPRHVLPGQPEAGELRQPQFIGPAGTAGAIIRSLAAHLDGATRAGQSAVDEGLLLQLAAAALGRRDGGYTAAYAAAARTYIGSHLAEPGLSASQIATAVGISPRHLSRVFAGEGTTVPRYLLEQRLEAARDLLQGREAATVTIREAAHRCGFLSVSRFSSAFTARFGEHASDIRRRAVQLTALTE